MRLQQSEKYFHRAGCRLFTVFCPKKQTFMQLPARIPPPQLSNNKNKSCLTLLFDCLVLDMFRKVHYNLPILLRGQQGMRRVSQTDGSIEL